MKKFMVTILILLTSIAATALAANPKILKQGETIYKKACAICHMSGVAKAPIAHDLKDWKARYKQASDLAKKQNPNASKAQLKEKIMDILVSNVKKGMGAMPPKGMCPQCSDEDYKDAITFMMSKK